jgi:hypothetical protein
VPDPKGQWLKPILFEAAFVTAEAVTHKDVRTMASSLALSALILSICGGK